MDTTGHDPGRTKATCGSLTANPCVGNATSADRLMRRPAMSRRARCNRTGDPRPAERSCDMIIDLTRDLEMIESGYFGRPRGRCNTMRGSSVKPLHAHRTRALTTHDREHSARATH